jgi:tetratricopeptide (TPR) repeat protein
VSADPELQKIAGMAQERLESEPYVVKFLASARDAQRSGEAKEVERLLAKARALDPSHPGIAEIERSMPATATAASVLTAPATFGAPAESVADSYGGGDSESARRIRELLAEGQAASDRGDPQAAIDAWSRIFLIDIDHQEASRRIEQARKLKAEKERQVEEIFHDGLGAIESRDLERARRSFQQVLELQPGHVTAREYLDQLAAGVVPVVRMTSREMPAVSPEALPTPADFESGAADDLKEEILVPPDPSEVAAKSRPRREPKPITAKSGKPWRLFIGVGATVLLLVAAAFWYVLQNRDSLFPNSQPDDSAVAAPASHLIDRAKNQHQSGKTDLAMAQLRRVPPSDPRYKEAQELLAKWSGASPAATRPAGPSPEVLSRRQTFLDQARAAFTERSYLRAVESFEKAAALGALEADDATSLAEAQTQVAPLAKYVELYNQHDWEFIVRDLWEMHLKDPGNRDVTRLLVDSYYNLAVMDLQQSDAKSASQRLSEVSSLAQGDETLRRQQLFAQTYQDRDKDLLYRIYVKYLPFR